MDAQLLSRGATLACSGHVVGPIGSTRRSFGAFVGVGGSARFGAGFLLLCGWSSLTEGCCAGCCLKTAIRLHNRVYNYNKNITRILNNTPGQMSLLQIESEMIYKMYSAQHK